MKPATMPTIAPMWFARFQNTPSTRAGNSVEAASENAAPTSDRMSAGFCEAA